MLGGWLSRDISEESPWFLVEASHWSTLICFCQRTLLQNFGFWELIKTKSLRGKWGQGHCHTTWLGFSSMLVCGIALTMWSRLINRTCYILENEWSPVLGDSWVECVNPLLRQKWDLWGFSWKLQNLWNRKQRSGQILKAEWEWLIWVRYSAACTNIAQSLSGLETSLGGLWKTRCGFKSWGPQRN